MSNFQVLYRQEVDYSFLVILYEELTGSPSTVPNEFYAFQEQTEREIMMEEHIPVTVKNIHGIDLYKNYISLGWIDITHAKDLLPTSLQIWLTQNRT